MSPRKDAIEVVGHQDRVRDLSIALEFKFLVPFLPRFGISRSTHSAPKLETVDFIENEKAVRPTDKLKLWRQAFSGIANAIRTIPDQKALTIFDLEDQDRAERSCWSTHWIVKKSNSAEPVKDDPLYDGCIWVPTEVNSPKMTWVSPRTFETIAAVMEAIRKGYQIVANHTCEVHVHVGRLDGREFSLTTLKKLAMLLWLAEPTLRNVKDPTSPNFDHIYTWSSPARQHSRLAKKLKRQKIIRPPRPRDLAWLDRSLRRCFSAPSKHRDALILIARCCSYPSLGRVMSGEGRPYRRLGFNFSAFGGEDERARTNPKTVECRFLEGTADIDVITSWMRIFGMIVEISLDSYEDDQRFSHAFLFLLFEKGWVPPEEAFVDLMKKLGFGKELYAPVQAMVRGIHRGNP